MIRVCPNPAAWCAAYERLASAARQSNLDSPPRPIILSGWWYTNDTDKLTRWLEMIQWATTHGCMELLDLKNDEFYVVETLTTHQIGPMGGVLKRPWDFESKPIPSHDTVDAAYAKLSERWSEIVGESLAEMTVPVRFTGTKKRRLLVRHFQGTPPWGGWTCLSHLESERRTFTAFRSAINLAISPHEVDHIDFMESTD